VSRDVATDMLAAIQAGTLRPVLFYEGQFRNTGTLAVEYMRLWTGYGTTTWNGQTWYGVDIISVEGIEETTQKRSVGFRVALNGISSSVLAVALDADKSKYLLGKIWLGALNSSGAIIADPYLSREGKLNRVSWADNGEKCDISAEYEDENVTLLKPDDRRNTPEDQAIDHPGDRGFDQVAQLQDIVIAF